MSRAQANDIFAFRSVSPLTVVIWKFGLKDTLWVFRIGTSVGISSSWKNPKNMSGNQIQVPSSIINFTYFPNHGVWICFFTYLSALLWIMILQWTGTWNQIWIKFEIEGLLAFFSYSNEYTGFGYAAIKLLIQTKSCIAGCSVAIVISTNMVGDASGISTLTITLEWSTRLLISAAFWWDINIRAITSRTRF